MTIASAFQFHIHLPLGQRPFGIVGAFYVIVKTGCGTDGSFYSTTQDSKPGANGSKSVYSAPLSQIGSSTNLQNGELL